MLTLPAETRVLPGHGDELTVATAEKQFDAWVRRWRRPGRPSEAARRARAAEPRYPDGCEQLGLRACPVGCTRARRPGSAPGWTARAGTG